MMMMMMMMMIMIYLPLDLSTLGSIYPWITKVRCLQLFARDGLLDGHFTSRETLGGSMTFPQGDFRESKGSNSHQVCRASVWIQLDTVGVARLYIVAEICVFSKF